jgi:DNA anti-recombination protein RmuC
VLTEVLKIQPKLDDKELNKMEKSLGSRFARIAKGFGRGLKLASVAALGAAVLDKLVNPLNEVKQAIDRTLGKADDIVTNAKQFNTSTEKLAQAQGSWKRSGSDQRKHRLAPDQVSGGRGSSKAKPE